MALTLYEAGMIARDADFQLRVAMASYRVAHEVLGEDEVENHPLRINLARTILNQDLMSFGRFATMIIGIPQVYQSEAKRQQDITDEVITSYLRSMWNDLSGANPSPPSGHTHSSEPQPTMRVYPA